MNRGFVFWVIYREIYLVAYQSFEYLGRQVDSRRQFGGCVEVGMNEDNMKISILKK